MLHKLSDEMLVQGLHDLVRTERKITHQIIEAIAEIDRRDLYLVRGYPSLFEFLVHKVGYSESAASRRIGAVRLFQQIPEVAQQIEAGTINLSQASLLTQTVRAADKSSHQPVTPQQKRDILKKIENCSFQKSQQIIHRELGVLPPTTEKSQTFGDGSITLSITLNADQAARWQTVSELCSHAIGNQTTAELMDYLASKEIARRTEIKRASPIRKSASQNARLIPPNVRKVLLKGTPAQLSSLPPAIETATASTSTLLKVESPLTAEAAPGCTYQDLVTGKRCGSRRFLQMDHRQSVWAGGGRQLSNLQLLCASHNRWKYRMEAGVRKSTFPIRMS